MPEKAPNIVLIMADQLAPQFTGAYGHPVVKSTAKPTIFLSKQQAGKFCRLGDADRTKRPEWGRRTTVVTGLDVQWNEECDNEDYDVIHFKQTRWWK